MNLDWLPWRRTDTPAPHGEAEDGPDEELGGYYVPADTTFSQILDYVSGTGDVDVLGDLALTSGGGALSYTALHRAITVLTGMIARVIVDTLRVVDQDGNRATGPRAETALRLMRQSPDGMCAAYTWHEDALSDLLTDGNVLAVVRRDARDRPVRLERAVPWGSYVVQTRERDWLYHLRLADQAEGTVIPVAMYNTIHGRFGRIRRSGSNQGSTRQMFATPPVQVYRRAARTGIAADRHILRFFSEGGSQASTVGVVFEGNSPTPDQAKELRKWFRGYRNSRDALIVPFPGARLVQLNQPVQSEATGKLREFQIRDVTRLYGVPPPVLGENVTSWGSGIAELARMTWRFGAGPFAYRYLEAAGYRLLRPGDRFMLDPSEFTRPDPGAMATLIDGMLGGTPYGTRAEARRFVGLPRTPDGEIPTRREGGTGPGAGGPPAPSGDGDGEEDGENGVADGEGMA